MFDLLPLRRSLLKKIFLSIAGCIFVLLIVWPYCKSHKEASTFTKPLLGSALKMMNGVQFEGITAKGEPYTIHSQKITQATGQDFTLNQIAIVYQSNNQDLHITAQEGSANMIHKEIQLSNGIAMTLQDGSILKTASATLNFNTGTAIGRDTVQATGPLGTLNANGFEIEDKGKILRFVNGVKVTFSPSALTAKD